jgi:hypothetical protein
MLAGGIPGFAEVSKEMMGQYISKLAKTVSFDISFN